MIDARGLIVAPGFIDMHSHSDMTLLEDGAAQSKIRQGVTTEILGEDTSAGPAKGKQRSRLHRAVGETLTWTTLGGYFDTLERQGIAVNVASYVGLGTLLECVQGDSLDRPDAEQLEAMKHSSTRPCATARSGCRPCSPARASWPSPPTTWSRSAGWSSATAGCFSSHIRNEGTEVFAAVKEAIAVGRAGRRPGRHHPSEDRRPDRSGAGCARSSRLIDAGAARGSQRSGQCLSLHARQ